MMSSPSGKIRLTSHCELAGCRTARPRQPAPIAASPAARRRLLEVDYGLFGVIGHYHLLRCPHCSVRFTDAMATMDYAGDELVEIGWPAYYAQLGAGIWPISDPLTRITKPAGATGAGDWRGLRVRAGFLRACQGLAGRGL